jgi:hypothetical protein
LEFIAAGYLLLNDLTPGIAEIRKDLDLLEIETRHEPVPLASLGSFMKHLTRGYTANMAFGHRDDAEAALYRRNRARFLRSLVQDAHEREGKP